ncbi:AMP-binding protein [Aquisalimonas sp.]|uniref:AMP-binding protein n=1 Tax=unclassified Aquisalimonas TaxID=2644645 RepID=UPI0025BC9914|nr:AMP-binding protein [Aquisalimonas sp.]
MLERSGPPEQPEALESALLDVLRELVAELRREPVSAVRVDLDSTLETDLGLDSLARAEAILRIESRFRITLPTRTLSTARTPRDLAHAVRDAHTDGASHGAATTIPAETTSVMAGDDHGRPDAARTLLDVLDWHVRTHPDMTQLLYLSEGQETPISYAELRVRAASVAGRLQAEGLEWQQSVAIMLPTCPEYFYTYFGVLLAGGVPVPIYPPARLAQVEDHVRRHAGILANAEAVVLVTVGEAMTVARLLESSCPTVRRVLTADALVSGKPGYTPIPVSPEDIAFIQYTSGSTGSPKGVVLTHDNLLANIRAIGEAVEITPRDVFVSWLPLYHDMGLISAWLASLYFGNPLVVMSPLEFLARPANWLWAIHRYQGTLTAAPNFAYELCIKRVDDDAIQGLDLSSLRMMANGAEPVSPDTLTRFTQRFSRYGLRDDALLPVYGLAEATVGLLVPPLGRPPVVDHIQRERFTTEGEAVPAEPDDPNPLRFVACGRPLPAHEVRIVDASGRTLDERHEGRLEFRGPSATSGYFHNPEQTRSLFDGDWLDSGDRAYAADGEYYITGRVKDIIIRGGRNLYPHELEEAVGAVKGVRKGCVAVFGSADRHTGTERLVVMAETGVTAARSRAALQDAIQTAALDMLGEPADEVLLVPPHTVLKTSSGKIRRGATRALYESGEVGKGPRRAWWTYVRVGGRSLLAQARRVRTSAGTWSYGIYMWAVLCCIGPPVWLLVAATPRPAVALAITRLAARILVKLSATPVRVAGLANLPESGAAVYVANHASLVDGVVLLATLPRDFAFVAKRELLDWWLTGVFLRRLGTECVARADAAKGVEEAQHLMRAAAGGKSLFLFPEGTFTDRPGLLPFHLGAFVVAANARVPVVPVAISGTRTVLRDRHRLPRRGRIHITVCQPVNNSEVSDDRFGTAVQLRAVARERILEHADEPDAAGPGTGVPQHYGRTHPE